MLSLEVTLADRLIVVRSHGATTRHPLTPDLKISTVLRPHIAARRKQCLTESTGAATTIPGPTQSSTTSQKRGFWRNLFGTV